MRCGVSWFLAGVLLPCLPLQSAYGAGLKLERSLRMPVISSEMPDFEKPDKLRWEGYLKGLVISSRLPQPENDRYTLAITRLRLKLDGGSDSIRFHVEHDLELSRSNLYSRPASVQPQAEAPSPTRWGGESVLNQGAKWRIVQQPYRAVAAVRRGPLDVALGRQRIPLGVGRFYSALDVLNPNNRGQVETEEKIGVDALRGEYAFESGSRLMGVVAPAPTQHDANILLRPQFHVHASDVAFTFGRVRRDRLFGVDVATQWRDAGLRGELALVRPEIGSSYSRALVGVDYGFVNGMNLAVEGYASGQSKADHEATLQADPWRRYVEPPGRRYLAGELRYEPNPLLLFSSTTLYNIQDKSAHLGAKMQYVPVESVVFTFGFQTFFGETNSEFGTLNSLGYLSGQWYF